MGINPRKGIAPAQEQSVFKRLEYAGIQKTVNSGGQTDPIDGLVVP